MTSNKKPTGKLGQLSATDRKKQNFYRHATLFSHLALEPADEILKLLKTSLPGLSTSEAQARLEQYGPNEVAHEDYAPWAHLLLKAVWNPFNLLVSSLAMVSYLTHDVKGAVLMAAMVLLSACLTFFQELRSSLAADRLRGMVGTTATVIRRQMAPAGHSSDAYLPTRYDLPLNQLVPGDIVHLSAGDMIPADIRLLSSKHFFVSQSGLTGESVPVEKSAHPEGGNKDSLAELQNICFMGSNVLNGTAVAVVVKTGADTYFGSIAKSVLGQRAQTSFDLGVKQFTRLMLKFMVVMVPLVFFINGFTKGDWSDAFLFAIAVAIGLTPEMLPMILTVNLAKGALSMSRKKVIVKRLSAIQNFGAMNILCTDKTGTLTEEDVVYGSALDCAGAPSETTLRFAYLNSVFQTGLKNFLDIALIKHAERSLESKSIHDYIFLDEVPFDFSRKRMSVLVQEKDTRQVFLVCKGAVEEVLSCCHQRWVGEKTEPMDAPALKACQDVAVQLNEQGLRVLAVAIKKVQTQECSLDDESGCTHIGFVTFLDPPVKNSAQQAIQALSQMGVAIKILTGDNERVTKKVANAVGLSSERVLLGHEVDALEEADLFEASKDVAVFAKLTPAQKQRIVRTLHDGGHVVGFLGDGINDAPALRAADVGISVNNAVDIAKESADVILLEKNLLVLEQGAIEGRKVFGNIVKYIKMGASSNFGNVFSLLGASVFLPFLPMKPVQLLTQNLLYDFSQAGIPLDRVDAEYLQVPRKWEIADLARFMLFMGPISSLFDYATFALLWFVFKANHPDAQALFQSGWFVEGLISQTLIVHLIRTRKIPFFQSRASWGLTLTTVSIMAIGVYLPFSAVGSKLGLVPLPLSFFPWLVGFLFAYCLLTQVAKNAFIRRYGYN